MTTPRHWQTYSSRPTRVRLLVALLTSVIVLLPAMSVFYTRAYTPTRVYAAQSSELNFQSRLSAANGSSVPDGNYHVEFKLYNVATGGTAEWTETRTTGNLVRVVNGYMSVQLGSVTAFPGTIDWSQEHWLTMNIGGAGGSPSYDGEMNPRIKLTAVPLAFRALQSDRLTNGASSLAADDLLQKAPLSIQSVNAAIAGLRFNQIGAGGLVQLQTDGVDTFTIGNDGSVFTAGSLNVAGGNGVFGTSTQAGSLTLNDGSGQTGAISTVNLTANRTYTLPDTSGEICLTSTCDVSQSFMQNGNAFAALATLGTTDNNALTFITSGTRKLTILANGNVGIGNDTPTSLLSVGASEQFTVSSTGAVSTTGITSSGALSVTSGGASITGGVNNNSGGITNAGSITGVGANITGSSGLTIASGGSGDLRLDSASDALVLLDPTLRRTAAGSTTIDLVDGNATSLVLTNSGAGLAGLSIEGGLSVGNGSFNVSSNGNVTAAMTALNGTSTTNGTSGLTPPSTSLVLADATNFDVGNYVQVNSANCGGSGVNPCYAKITAKAGNTLTIAPGLTWASGVTVNEYQVPELGGSNTTSPLANRFGRGYFISGVATGNGTTIYEEDRITSTLSSFDLLNTGVTSLNIGGAATNLTIGSAATTINIPGTVSTGGTARISNDGTLRNVTGSNANGVSFDANTITSGTLSDARLSSNVTLLGNTFNGVNQLVRLDGGGALTALNGSALTNLNGSAISSGTVAVSYGGTGKNTFTTNGIVFGDGINPLKVTAAGTGGQLLIAGSGGTPGFVTLSGDATLSDTGLFTISANSVALGTDTVGDFLGSLGSLTGLSSTTTAGEGSVLNLSVLYGALANTAAQGNTALTFTGTGNFTGALSGTAGGGFTTTTLAIRNDPTFTTSVTTPSLTNAGNLGVSATGGSNVLTLSAAGQVAVNAGTTIELQDNTNITGNLGITGGITSLNYAQFNANASNPAFAEGLVFYDNVKNALSYYNSEAAITMNIGQENYIYVYNNTGATISDGQAVYVNGADATSGVSTIALAQANTMNTSMAAGIATHSIEAGTFGYVTRFGEISGLNTSTFAAGDTLYLSAATPGGLTNVRPNQPNFTNVLARVTSVNATTGKIMVLVGDTRFGAYTTGAIAFGGTDGGIKEDATALFYDNTNKRLGIGTSAPAATLSVGANLFQVAGTTGNITTSGDLALNGGDLTSTGALSIASGTGLGLTLTSASGTITTASDLALNGGDLTSTGALTLTSGGAGALTFNSASNVIVLDATDTTIRRTGATGLTIDLANGTATTLNLSNSTAGGANVANLNIDGVYQIGGTSGQSVTCGNNQYLNQISVVGGIVTSSNGCNGVGLSDQRLKTNVVELDSTLDKLGNINFVSFDFICNSEYFTTTNTNCDASRQSGVIAQQLATVFPELVYQDEFGYFHVKYDALSIYNLKATTELAAKVNSAGDATLNTVATGGTLRLNTGGGLENINGLNIVSNGASIRGGLDNNFGGITNVGAISGATTISGERLVLNGQGAENLLTLKKDGNGVFTIFSNGATEILTDSANAFAVKDSGGLTSLNVDTQGRIVSIGSINGDGTVVLFTLDNKNTDGDPTGVAGAQYYNSKLERFRCFQDGRWQDCIPAATSEFVILAGKQQVAQSATEQELAGQPRTYIDFSSAREIKLIAQVDATGAAGSNCRLQYALTDTGPWNDLFEDTAAGKQALTQAGLFKTEWKKIVPDARQEVIVRVMCQNTSLLSSPDIGNIRLQLR